MIETRELLFTPTEFRSFYTFQVDTNTSVNNTIAKSVTITAWYQDDPTNKYRVVVNGVANQSWVIPFFNSDGSYSGQSYAGSVASVDFVTPTFIPLPAGPNSRSIVVDYSFETDYFIAGIIRVCSDASLGNQIEFDASSGVLFSAAPKLAPTYRIPWNPAQIMNYYQFAYRVQDTEIASSVGKSLTVKTWYASKPNDVYESSILIGQQTYSQAQTAVVFYYSDPTLGVPFSNENTAPSGYYHVIPTLVSPTSMPVDHTGDEIVFEVTGDISYINGFNILMSSNPSYSSYSDQILPDAISLSSVVPTIGSSGGSVTPPADTPPVANPDTAVTPFNTPVTISPLGNDQAGTGALVASETYVLDAGQPVKTASLIEGSLVVNSDGTIVFTPTDGFVGQASPFTYRVTDANGLTSDSTVTVTVQAEVVNQPPVARPDIVVTPRNTAITFSSTGNDSVGSAPLDLSKTYVVDGGVAVKSASVTGGSITVNDNGTILFDPTVGFVGDVSFTYRITDTNGLTSDSTVTVTVQAPTPPTANPDTITTPYNTAVTISPSANDQAGTGALVASETYVLDAGQPVKSVTLTEGSVTVHDDGTIVFLPTDGFVGQASPFTYRITDANGLTADSTVTVTVQAAPVNTPPVANPDTAVTPYNTPVTISPSANDTAGTGPLVTSGTYVLDAGQPVKTATFTDGSVVVNDDGTIVFTPADGFAGDTPFGYRITDINGLTADSTITVTVQAEVVTIPVAVPSPIRGAKWFLGDFETGILDAEPFPCSTDDVSLSIHGDEADVTVPLYGLSSSDRINWKNKFEPGQRFAAYMKGETVIFAGPIAKRDPNFKDETIVIKARGFKWWLESIFLKKEIGQTAITSETEKVTFKGSPATVAKMIVKTAITGEGFPQSVEYADSVTGDYVFEATLSELTSVSEALDKISNDPLGVETTFRPKKVGNKIVWPLIAGNPHLNEDETTIAVDLTDNNQVVDFSQIDDITESHNTWWLGSNVATGSNLKAQTAPGNTKLIRESKDKFAVTLTADELAAQYSARFEDSNKRYINTTLSLWDVDLSLWNQTGRRFSITGDEQSAGFSDIVRCIGVNFSSTSPVIQLKVDAIRRVYPTLPNRVDDALKWKNIDTSNSGSMPWNPGDVSNGGLSNSDLWGDAGLPSMGGAPSSGPVLTFSNYAHTVLSPRYPDGGKPVIHPATMVQGSGNRFFGLDKNRWTAAGVVPAGSNLSVRDIIGRDQFTEKFHIRSAFLNNGNISQVVGSGSFGAEHVYETMADMEFQGNGYAVQSGNLGYTQDQQAVSIEVIGSMFASITRVYFQIAVIATHIWEGHKNDTGQRNYVMLKNTSITSFWSAPVNTDGVIVQDWSREINLPNNEFTFPAHMTKYGEKIAYTSAVVVPSTVSLPIYYDGTHIDTELTPETVPETNVFKTLPIQQLPRVRVGEGGGGLWYSFPQTSLDSTSPHATYGVCYNGWLYVIHAHKQEGPGIYRIRVTSDGVIPPDAIWVRTGDLDWTNTSGIIYYGLAVVPGFLVYSSSNGTSYLHLNDDGGTYVGISGTQQGTTNQPQTVPPEFGILTGYKSSGGSDYYMQNEYRADWSGYITPEKYSRPMSYAGYIYYFYSDTTIDSTLHLYSVKTTS